MRFESQNQTTAQAVILDDRGNVETEGDSESHAWLDLFAFTKESRLKDVRFQVALTRNAPDHLFALLVRLPGMTGWV